MIGFTRGLARQLGEWNIAANCIVPSVILTPTSLELYEDGVTEALVSQQAIKRAQQPEDLVGVLVFLASESSQFITGQTIMVDGDRLGGRIERNSLVRGDSCNERLNRGRITEVARSTRCRRNVATGESDSCTSASRPLRGRLPGCCSGD